MTQINIIRKLIHNADHCGLCFQNILEESCYYIYDEVTFDTKTSAIYNVLINLLGTSVPDNIFCEKFICEKCTEKAIISYKFIQMCRNNFQKFARTAKSLLEYTENYTIKNKCKSVFFTLNEDKCCDKIYQDTKKYKPKLGILKRFQYLQRKQEQENLNLSKVSEGRCQSIGFNNTYEGSIQRKLGKRKTVKRIKLSEILYEKDDENNYKCKDCLKVYVSMSKMKQHYCRVHAPKKFKCTKCPRSFGSPLLLNRHTKDSHCNVVCSQCGKTYNNMYSLRHHEKTHNIHLVCQNCGKAYKVQQSFNNHIKNKLCQNPTKLIGDAKFTCDYCQKKYTQKTALSVHIRLEHENGKALVCDWCGKKFSSVSRLNDHILKHTKQKNFQCNICGGKFVTKMSLIYHTRLHTGEKPYKCEHCDMTFLSASRRSEHVKRHHSGPDLECDMCHGKFKGQTCLIRHKKRHFNVSSRLYHNMAVQ